MTTTIPVVLAADKNYAPQMYVTILSILENKNSNTAYDFYLLIPEKFSNTLNDKFYQLTQDYENCSINFLEMGEYFSNQKMYIRHITSPTFYRLKMPEFLQQYDKAIYLDVDTIVLKDLTEYFNTDIENYYIGGVPAAGYIMYYLNNKTYYDSIGIPDISTYINAGVTLWNLKKIREDNLTDKLYELSKNEYASMDQDIINVAFYGKIKLLPLKYNLMTKYTDIFNKNFSKFELIYEIQDMLEAINDPVIIHYADKIKPWNNPKTILGDIWWEYARQSSFFVFKKYIPMIKNIFSIENEDIRKVITIFGLKIKIRSKKLIQKKQIKNFDEKIYKLHREIIKQDIKIDNLIKANAKLQNKINIISNNLH